MILDIYDNGGYDSGIAFVLENDNIVNCYHEIREDYDLEPLESTEFSYVYRLPEDYDGSDITVHMDVANDKYDFTFEKNEKSYCTCTKNIYDNILAPSVSR